MKGNITLKDVYSSMLFLQGLKVKILIAIPVLTTNFKNIRK